MINLGDNTR